MTLLYDIYKIIFYKYLGEEGAIWESQIIVLGYNLGVFISKNNNKDD